MTVVVGTQAPGPSGLFVHTETGESCRSLFDDRWDDLVRRQPLPNPTLSATWLRHLVEWKEERRPVAIVVEQDGALVAAGAFDLYRPAGRVGPTFARWLGDYRQWFSPDILVDPEESAAGRPSWTRCSDSPTSSTYPLRSRAQHMQHCGRRFRGHRAPGGGELDRAAAPATHEAGVDEVRSGLSTRCASRCGGHGATRFVAR